MTFKGEQLPCDDSERTCEQPSHVARTNPEGAAKATDREFGLAVRKALLIPDDSEFERAIDALDAQRPRHHLLWAARVRRLIRQKAIESAVALLNNGPLESSPGDPRLYEKVELLCDLREHERAENLFRTLVNANPGQTDLRTRYAKRLLDDGYLVRACEVLAPVREAFAEGGKDRLLADSSANLQALLTSLEGRVLTADEDTRIIAMKHAILHFRRRSTRRSSAEGLGRLCLITGGLGPGGAERQLTRLAIELERARKENRTVGRVSLPSQVEVVVRTHSPEKQNDFYLGDLLDAGVGLHQINEFPALTPEAMGVENATLLQLLAHLPPAVNYGVKRLTQHFSDARTDTASIWQDGACLFAGLAALIAGVPHIQLAIRGLPPSVRRHMYRPEYEVLYRAMAEVPGVTFVSNSIAAAKSYANWLDVDVSRFQIVYNGVKPMSGAGSFDCERLWREFNARTAGASETIGGVFRFDTDKQPLTWIRFAARYLKRHESARFILVGGGRLLEHAIKLAEDYGIEDRILFVGRSTHVGFWMEKMDVLVLLSRFEGLPNVLIEAQYMGVQVVTTPAGGAAECLIDGVSGHVLECVEKPDYQKMIARVHDLARGEHDRDLFEPGGRVRQFLDGNFSIQHMLEQYVACTARALVPPAEMPIEPEAWGEAA